MCEKFSFSWLFMIYYIIYCKRKWWDLANKKGKRAKDNKRRKSKQDLEPEEFVPKAFKKKDNKDIDKSAKTKGKRADNKKTSRISYG